MIVKFVAWRLAIAAAFAFCAALAHATPAAAATSSETAARGARTTGTPVARVHALGGTSLPAARPASAQPRPSLRPARQVTSRVVTATKADGRVFADGILLEDGTFAGYANY